MYGNLSKCGFFESEVMYLGYINTSDGIAVDLKKIHAIMDWPSPTNVLEVCSFMGLVGYYHRFMKDFS